MNKEQIYRYLKQKNIWYEITKHKAVYNMKDLQDVDLPYPEGDAKNLFVRDDKKRNYYLITVKGTKKVDLKEFRHQNNTRPLSFVNEKELLELLNLKPGSVTPLGLLNDKEHKVEFFIDNELLEEPGIIGVHPNENTATVWLKTRDLITILKENNVKVYQVQI
ncbi:YbaK/EbsC family protein [uncultured Psychrobacillus sp.]|jgi:hypothetical protein|uniref:prolyl-tRNA synthetase associated domain-containing protein n=1 Tax=uncultured Psychrobacillus sp. TaxID=1551585 RepID=UPI000338F7AA|nr:YbaK/EbsC family protein [uncultured Psychrobacillus sp.]CCY79971.1 ybaK/proline--tRNA ligase associated domain protein [Mycoplasma sp. CAG:877]